MDECKMRGSQIPAFGNWEYVNDLPITQYFECARQAGLIRYSSSSGECDRHHHQNLNQNYNHHQNQHCGASPDLYTVDFMKPRTAPPRPTQGKGREKRAGNTHVKEGSRKQAAGKVFDVTVTEFPQQAVKRHPPNAVTAVKKKQQQFQHDATSDAQPRRAPKAVDEDLYKIPPELLKRKKRLGFISRCLVPPCAV